MTAHADMPLAAALKMPAHAACARMHRMAEQQPGTPAFPPSPFSCARQQLVAGSGVRAHSEVLEAPAAVELRAPPMYQVVMLNDDFTPMEFVVVIIEEFFGHGREAAVQLMLRVHHEGRAVCGVYSHDVADTKAAQVCEAARGAGYPLQCIVEPAA